MTSRATRRILAWDIGGVKHGTVHQTHRLLDDKGFGAFSLVSLVVPTLFGARRSSPGRGLGRGYAFKQSIWVEFVKASYALSGITRGIHTTRISSYSRV